MRSFSIRAVTLTVALLCPLAESSPATAQKASADLSDVVAPLLAEVVNVTTVRITPTPQGSHREVFAGSGFIIDPSGLIVTNNHVADGAAQITVTLHDNTILPATLLGQDELTDLAVLKVKSEAPLPAAQFGDSEKLRVGQPVIAIGNPYAIGTSVSAGIVSALGRDMRESPYDDYIQTDAAINHGNSGGPLFDLAGQVVGVNSVVFSPSEQGGSIGLGFAVPSNEARFVATQLVEQGFVRRGWLGARIQNVTPAMADALGLARAEGAIVVAVIAGSPAAKAGLQAEDVILTFDGREMTDFRMLSRAVATREIGTSVPLTVWRDGNRSNMTVIVSERPGDRPRPPAPAPASPIVAADDATLGLTLVPLSRAFRTRFRLDDAQTGVAVSGVELDSAAADQGLRVGDLIVRVGQQMVTAPAEISKDIATARGGHHEHVLMLVQGQDGLRWVALRLRTGA